MMKKAGNNDLVSDHNKNSYNSSLFNQAGNSSNDFYYSKNPAKLKRKSSNISAGLKRIFVKNKSNQNNNQSFESEDPTGSTEWPDFFSKLH